MPASLSRQTDGTLTLTFSLPWAQIQTNYQKQIQKAVTSARVPGFRPGKAPRSLVEKDLDSSALYSQTLRDLFPPLYEQALKDHGLRPLLLPQIKLTKSEPNQDWQFTAATCEAPPFSLPDYKAAAAKIAIKDPPAKLQSVIDYLTKNTAVPVPQLLIEEETRHRLSSLADNLTQLGLTSAQYLQTKKLTLDQLNSQIALDSTAALVLDFILDKIASEEHLADRTRTLDFLRTL